MTSSSKRTSWVRWLLLAALFAAIGLGIVRALNKREAQQKAASAAAAAAQQEPIYQLSPKDLATVQTLELEQVVPVSGALKATRSALIKARVAGELQELQKREGDAVRAGEVVARIDSSDAQARVRQADQQAKAAEAQVGIAKRSLDNNQALVRQGFISATALENASATLAGAVANHEAALAALDIARKSLADTTLKSPLSGQVAARLAQNGERVGVDARILEVVDLSSFELEAALAPGAARSVQIGQKALLRVEGLEPPVDATVDRINPTVQAGSRSVLVYLRVPAAAGMRQGLFAQGSVTIGRTTAAALPLSAVRNDRPEPYIQILREGRVVHLPVNLERLGQRQGEPMLVVDGIADAPPGTQLLSVGAGLIREGTAVTQATPATAPAGAQPATASH